MTSCLQQELSMALASGGQALESFTRYTPYCSHGAWPMEVAEAGCCQCVCFLR